MTTTNSVFIYHVLTRSHGTTRKVGATNATVVMVPAVTISGVLATETVGDSGESVLPVTGFGETVTAICVGIQGGIVATVSSGVTLA